MDNRNRSNDNRQTILHNLFVFAFLLSGFVTAAQTLTITGPECVRSGVEYQYIIRSSSDSMGRVQACLQGGVFTNSKQDCIGDSILTELRVTWTDSLSGELTLRAGGGSFSKAVRVAQDLHPGSMLKEKTVRKVKEGSMTDDILYSPATGGGCNPKYVYQWQQSDDNMHWSDVSDSDKQKFSFSSAPTRSLYFRRKVTDVNSGNIAYTEPVAVFFEKVDKSAN